MRSKPAGSATIAARRYIWKQLTLVDSSSPRLWIQYLEGDLSGILFAIVDELAVIPVTSGNYLALNRDGAGPGGTTSCNFETKVISYPLSKACELKVGVQPKGGAFFLLFFCKTPLLPAMLTHETHSEG